MPTRRGANSRACRHNTVQITTNQPSVHPTHTPATTTNTRELHAQQQRIVQNQHREVTPHVNSNFSGSQLPTTAQGVALFKRSRHGSRSKHNVRTDSPHAQHAHRQAPPNQTHTPHRRCEEPPSPAPRDGARKRLHPAANSLSTPAAHSLKASTVPASRPGLTHAFSRQQTPAVSDTLGRAARASSLLPIPSNRAGQSLGTPLLLLAGEACTHEPSPTCQACAVAHGAPRGGGSYRTAP